MKLNLIVVCEYNKHEQKKTREGERDRHERMNWKIKKRTKKNNNICFIVFVCLFVCLQG